ncbi:PREDICTED: aquaporin-3-like [Acropora digitifera]|uniref:aquaporin-3-like n=1 Tax=Acropora digitifera TaxID=70779 RepID=UPI00077A82E7|nr:PREDICTED: aquaporin-3-like [Acropora digitifera]
MSNDIDKHKTAERLDKDDNIDTFQQCKQVFSMAKRFRLSPLMREAVAEFCGTFILLIFGIASVAQMVLSNWKFGNFFSVNFGWGIGVTLGCYWAGGVSGTYNRILFSTDALNAFDGGVRQVLGHKGTAGIWATYPQEYLSIGSGFADQFLGTALLVGCIFAITDKKNNSPNKGVAPVMIGLVVFVIGATFGFNCGYAINPARDLGPRIFTAMAGWGGEVFTAGNNWSWVPVIACLMGGVTGAFIYIGLIEMHHDSDEPNENGRELERIIINE